MALKFAVVGCGDAATSMLVAAGHSEKYEVVGAASWKYEETKAFAEKRGIRAYALDELVAGDTADVIAVTNPPGVHEAAAVAALSHGRHVIVEKPMALDEPSCTRMIEAAEKSGAKLMVGHTHRYFAAVRLIRKMIESGKYGRLLMIEDNQLSDYFTAKRTGWQLDPALSGGGVIMNPVIHYTDRIRYLAGCEVTAVSAQYGAAKPGYAIEGHVAALYRFEDSALSASLVCNGYGHLAQDRTRIHLESGIIQLDFFDNLVTVYRNGVLVERLEPEPPPYGPDRLISGYLEEVNEFAGVIENGAESSSDGYSGRMNVRICRAIFESADTGHEIVIDK